MFVTALDVPHGPVDEAWPFTIPAVAQLGREALRFDTAVTFLVGPNGAGKSTIIEAISEAYGIEVRGGHAGRRYATPRPTSRLGSMLRLKMAKDEAAKRGRRGRGFFLRAETALGM